MVKQKSVSRTIFTVFNYIVLIATALTCVLPLVHLLATSLSKTNFINAGMVTFWPRGFNLTAYKVTFETAAFWQALWVSVKRVVLGVPLSLIVTIFVAYPLSKPSKTFRGRTIYIVVVAIPMFISSGIVPYFLWLKEIGLMDTIWVLVLPLALSTGNAILLMNFIRMLPKDIEESAFVDGAGYFLTLFRIILPLCLPVLATLTLFNFVGHWNSWFDGMIFNRNLEHYPLQTYLKNIVDNIRPEDMESAKIALGLGNDQLNAAQVFVGMLPVILIYPFLQKYFVTGIVIGAVKG